LDTVVLVEEEVLIYSLKLVFVLLDCDIQILDLQVWVLVLVKWLRDEFFELVTFGVVHVDGSEELERGGDVDMAAVG
jgi:hypothetical protein